MIDRRVLEQLDPDVRIAVESAVLTIGNSGVLDLQLRIAFESIVEGAVNEAPEELTARILRYRQENHGVIGLIAYAEELKKESRT